MSKCENCPVYQNYKGNPDKIFDTPVVDKTLDTAYKSGEAYVEFADKVCKGPTAYIKDQEAFIEVKSVDGIFQIGTSAVSFQCELYTDLI